MRTGAVLYAKHLEQVAAFYAAVLGLPETARDAEHVRLEAGGFQLVVLRVPAHIAASIEIASPPLAREDCAVKLVFEVASLAAAREAAAAHGGMLNGPEREWAFDGCRVCDGLDPEGNVIQLRERMGD